jgi:hypothetical protein
MCGASKLAVNDRKCLNKLDFQRRIMPSRIHQLILKLTPNTDFEGVLAQENILNITGAILASEGAQVPSSKLIAGYHNSKK